MASQRTATRTSEILEVHSTSLEIPNLENMYRNYSPTIANLKSDSARLMSAKG